MNKMNFITSIALGLVLSTGLYSHEPCPDKDELVLNSIVYLEEDLEIDLGFNTADYLPEDFDPYTFYFDLNSVVFVEEDEIDIDLSAHLPEDFNAYANPSDFRNVSYIDPKDDFEFNFEFKGNLINAFEAYISK